MNYYTERQKQIISILSKSNNPVTCEEIISRIGFSRRTILNDIKAINNNSPIILSTNRGYTISKDYFETLDVNPILSVKEEHVLLRRLIMLSKTYSLEELADKMYVSESSLNKMLKSLGSLLDKYSLSIVRKDGQIIVEGKEYNKRKLINKLINEEIDNNFKSIYDITEMGNLDFQRLSTTFEDIIHKYNYYIDENYKWNLELNILIALSRIQSKIYIDTLPNNYINVESIEYKIANDLCAFFESTSSIKIEETDKYYIALQLIGQIKPIGESNSSTSLVSNELVNTLDKVLFETYNYYLISTDYHDFLYSFALHISAMIRRIQAGQEIINDMLLNIKDNSPFIYEVAVHIALKLDQIYSIAIPEEEIGLIAVYVGFSINKSISKINKINVQLLCNNYQNTYTSIKNYLLSNYAEQINFSYLDLSVNPIAINSNTDLIISTKVLNIIGKKMIIISPFNTMMDRFQIDDAIHTTLQEKEESYRFSLLSSFFNEDLFFKSNKYNTKEKAIRFLGNKLILFGIAKPGFTESVLEREKLSSTCFFDSFAIPHSTETNTEQSMFCILVSEEGILWDNHLIHIVLMIALQPEHRRDFVNIYHGIIRTLWNQTKLRKLIDVDSLSDFVSILIDDMPIDSK